MLVKTSLIRYDPAAPVRDLPVIQEGTTSEEPLDVVVERVRTAIRARQKTIEAEREVGSIRLLILTDGTAWKIE